MFHQLRQNLRKFQPTPSRQARTPVVTSRLTPTIEPATVTPTLVPAGMIFVDTLDQEVYPFVENGKCSLAEALFAANSAKPKDTCAAGGQEQSTIVLMPGIYHFTQADHTPQQGEWAYSTRTVGNALPAVIRTLTIRGNGATLLRDDRSGTIPFLGSAIWNAYTSRPDVARWRCWCG